MFFGLSVYNIWDNKDLNFYDKIEQTISEIFGFIGGTFLGGIGAELGASLGALLCPTMPIVGGALGIFIGAYFLGMLGNWIGKGIYKVIGEISKIFSGIIDDDNDGFGIGIIGLIRPPNDGDGGGGGGIGGGGGGGGPSPCAPAMRVGGVEFLLPKQIDNFRNFFSFNKCHYIAFEYEYDNFDIEKIIDLVNSKFLINNIKVKSLDEIYDTILKEISYGFLCQKELPSISLNFNKDGLLYSIMNNFYKNTLTGNILTFLDYYLKSYANGAFFKEEFIYEWQKEKNQDFDYLSRYLIDFKRYIYDTVNDPNELNYCSIYDLFVPGIDMSYENNYISAFRIIGNIHSNLSYYKNMFFPNCFYYTQYDFNIMPKWMKKINEEIIKEINENQGEEQEENVKRKKGKEEISSIILDEIHKIMANRVTILMKKIPFLQPYFELLKMITFAIHYLPNIHRTGLFPIFNKSIQNNHINIKYCKSIPKVFPPLPIRKTVTLEVKITPIELLNCFKNNNFKEINSFISICYYETENININKAIEKQNFLLDKIKKYIRNKIKNILLTKDKSAFSYLTDENMNIPKVLSQFKDILFLIPILSIKDDLNIILDLLDKEENQIIKPKKSQLDIYRIQNFFELKRETDEIMTIFRIYISQYENEINNLDIDNINNDYITLKYEDQINQNAINILKNKYNHLRNDEIEIMLLENDEKVIPIVDKIKNNLIQKEKKEILEKKNELLKKKNKLEDYLDNLNHSLENLQTKLIEYKLVNNELIQKIIPFLNKSLKIEIKYTKPIFRKKKINNEGNVIIEEEEKYFPIRGGCFPSINHMIKLNELEEFNNQSIKSLLKKKL